MASLVPAAPLEEGTVRTISIGKGLSVRLGRRGDTLFVSFRSLTGAWCEHSTGEYELCTVVLNGDVFTFNKGRLVGCKGAFRGVDTRPRSRVSAAKAKTAPRLRGRPLPPRPPRVHRLSPEDHARLARAGSRAVDADAYREYLRDQAEAHGGLRTPGVLERLLACHDAWKAQEAAFEEYEHEMWDVEWLAEKLITEAGANEVPADELADLVSEHLTGEPTIICKDFRQIGAIAGYVEAEAARRAEKEADENADYPDLQDGAESVDSDCSVVSYVGLPLTPGEATCFHCSRRGVHRLARSGEAFCGRCLWTSTCPRCFRCAPDRLPHARACAACAPVE